MVMARFRRWRTRNIRKAKGIFVILVYCVDWIFYWVFCDNGYYSLLNSLGGHCKSQMVVKNLRIVPQWWTLSESHLNFGVFQPSEVGCLRWSHYPPCFNFLVLSWPSQFTESPSNTIWQIFFLHLLIVSFANFGCLVLGSTLEGTHFSQVAFKSKSGPCIFS